ncbi:DUF881 domain-containing protein [Clostridium sp. ZS2-4]|uniref:DUF881 domain-containing protein n=1 Tax=Clostridium sp. ZS2-4 TaxID=2987703 RepID=UPI00227C4EF1|nr:DUF881 domain-containing protein [Clostridium sp. ZS2-4]MCY6354780.1 DUF881 domain-containing protein [Clostridium sp. ZS2-4]
MYKKFLTPIFVGIALVFSITGCTSTKDTASSDTNKKNIEIFTGKVDVEGKGVSITLTDNPADKQHIYGIVRDVDIIEIVNILKKVGAEVISVNDERVLSISKIKANKMMIRVNNNDFKPPFIIKAIGDPEVLNDELTMKLDYFMLRKNHIGIKIEKKDKLLIPKYKGNIDFQYAKPIE